VPSKPSPLDQLGAAGETQLLHDLAHILRVVAVGDQQRVFGVDDDQVFTPTRATNFLGL
jgi:hypothetical protein